MSARTDLAQLIGATLRAEGFLYAVPSVCYAVADAIIDRPGLVRALSAAETADNAADIMDETGIPLGRHNGAQRP